MFGIAFSFWFYVLLDWPFNGFVALTIATALPSSVCIIMGCFVFFLTLDPARAMSFAGAFTCQALHSWVLLFQSPTWTRRRKSGEACCPWVASRSTNGAIQLWRERGAQSLIESLTSMFWYAVPAFVVVLLIKKTLGYIIKATSSAQPEASAQQGVKRWALLNCSSKNS